MLLIKKYESKTTRDQMFESASYTLFRQIRLKINKNFYCVKRRGGKYM